MTPLWMASAVVQFEMMIVKVVHPSRYFCVGLFLLRFLTLLKRLTFKNCLPKRNSAACGYTVKICLVSVGTNVMLAFTVAQTLHLQLINLADVRHATGLCTER